MANTPVRQYIGARYVPLFAEPAEWDNTKTYEPLTIVLHNGNSYTSRQYVPAGIDITNTSFWMLTGNYNAQIEAYRKETLNALSLAQTNKTNIDDINAILSILNSDTNDSANQTNGIINVNKQYVTPQMYGAVANGVHDDTQAFIQAIETAKNTGKTLFLPIGKYIITQSIIIDFSIEIEGMHLSNFHYENTTTNSASIIYDKRTDISTPLITINLKNQGCPSIKNITIIGQQNDTDAIYISQGGWTLTIDNLSIDGFNKSALTFDDCFDSNLTNITITRCGRNSGNSYALNIINSSNALHFTNLHMEFNRRYINIDSCRHIFILNSKIEAYYGTQTDMESISNDYSAPYIRLTNNREIDISDSFFVPVGTKQWKTNNPDIDINTIPPFIQTSNKKDTFSHIKITNCFFTAPPSHGPGVYYSGSDNTTFLNCVFQDTAIETSSIKGENITLDNCTIYYAVTDATGQGKTQQITNSRIINTKFTTTDKYSITNISTLKLISTGNEALNNDYTYFPAIYPTEKYQGNINVQANTLSETALKKITKSKIYKIKGNISFPKTDSDYRGFIRIHTNYNIYSIPLTPRTNATNIYSFYTELALSVEENVSLQIFHTASTELTITYEINIY